MVAAKTYQALKEFAKRTQKRLDIIPVISPTWPFATEEANPFVKNARDIFGTSELLEISFDASLTFGEKVIVRDRGKYAVNPRTVNDYWKLAKTIREHNLTDPLTLIKTSQEKRDEDQNEESFKIGCSLVDRDPRRWKYWSLWTQSADALPSADKAYAFIDRHLAMSPKLANALVARANLRWTRPKDKLVALAQAIACEPGFDLAYFGRGRVLFQQRLFKQALEDFDKYVALSPKAVAGRIFHGLCSLSLQSYDAADEDFRFLVETNPERYPIPS